MEYRKFFKRKLFRKINEKNQNRRIWSEIFKVLLSSDLILYILDSRDPLGTWCSFIKKRVNKLDKKLILVLNKCDLVPAWLVSKWINIFSTNNIIIAFHSVSPQTLGKGPILNIIRQIKKTFLLKKKNLIIGVVGYPNVGKSTLINTLNGKKVVAVSPKSGETKIWQFIKLINQTFIIDSPGIIPNFKLDEIGKMVRGNIPLENLWEKNVEISGILKKINGLLNQKPSKFKNKKFIPLISNNLDNLCKLEKGGAENIKQKISFKMKKFTKGNIAWYAPFPYKKKNKIKTLKQKKWRRQKSLWIFCKSSTLDELHNFRYVVDSILF